MARHLKISSIIVLSLMLYSCGTNSSTTKIPVSTNSEEAEDLYHQAFHLNSIFKADEAKKKLIKAVEIDKDFGAAYIFLSQFGSNSGSETDDYYEKALSLKEQLNDVEKCILEIRTSYRDNDTEKRLEYSKKLLELIPNNAIAHQRMAYTHWDMGNIEESRKSLLLSIEKDKNYSSAYNDLASNYMFADPKNYEKAEKYAAKALSLNKKESYYHVLLGDVYRAQNKLQKAAEKYDDAYEAGTNNFYSAAKAGHAYTFIDPTEARKRFDQAINDSRNSDQKIGPEYAKVYTYLHENDFNKGHVQLLKLKNNIDSYGFTDEKKQEEISQILWHEYFIMSHSGQYDAAKTALEEKKGIDIAMAKRSTNERAVKYTKSSFLWRESHLEIMKGNYDGAKRKLAKLKEMVSSESNPKKFDGYHNLMGMTSLMSGNAEKGVEHFEKVVNQSNIYFQYYKGLAYKTSGDLDKAKEIFQSVATYNFNNLNYTAVRNKALKELGKG